jgi:hypothetical protein
MASTHADDVNVLGRITEVLEETNNMHWLYQSFILYTGSYMFRQ